MTVPDLDLDISLIRALSADADRIWVSAESAFAFAICVFSSALLTGGVGVASLRGGLTAFAFGGGGCGLRYLVRTGALPGRAVTIFA